MKVIIKPIQFEIKDEVEVEIEDTKNPQDLTLAIFNKKPELGNALDFMFRGKKLDVAKSLKDQGVKDKTKLMAYKSADAKPIEESNKEKARKLLYSQGQDKELTDKILNSINVENYQVEEIVERAYYFLNNLKKEEISEYALNLSEIKDITIDQKMTTSVFGIGDGLQGQLGVDVFIKSDVPLRINNLKKIKIKKIACGISHTVVLAESGWVFYFGKYFMPYLKEKTDFKTGFYINPQHLDSIKNELIVEIGCGSNHSLAINDKGEIFTWGEGGYGQLGHDNALNNEFYPRKVESLKGFKFKSVLGGATHSIAVTTSDRVFGWGSSEKNQLNMTSLSTSPQPIIIPLFDSFGNYTIDEIRSLNLDPAFSGKKQVNQPITNEYIANQMEVNIKDISYNIEDLMRVKLIDCGTWFTACTSQIHQSSIFIFGNFFKKVVRITFFEENNMEIKSLSASNYHVCVLTDRGIFKININNLTESTVTKGNEVVKITCIDEKVFDNIEKIGCGYDYLLALTSNRNLIHCKNFKDITILNSDLKCDVSTFYAGSTHCFLIGESNNRDFSSSLLEKCLSNINNIESNDFDIFLKSKDKSNTVFPCHSFIIEQFINVKIQDIERDRKNRMVLPLALGNEQILLLLELMYVGNFKILYSKETNNLIDDYAVLENISSNLVEIGTFLKDNQSQNTSILNEIIALIVEKILEIRKSEKFSKDLEDSMVKRYLDKTLNTIAEESIQAKMIDNLTNLKRQNSQEGEENDPEGEGDEDDDGEGMFGRGMRGRFPRGMGGMRGMRGMFGRFGMMNRYNQPQESFKGEGVAITGSSADGFDLDVNSIMEKLIATQRSVEKVNFHSQIFKLNKVLQEIKDNYIKDHLATPFILEVKNNNLNLKLNRLQLAFNSSYFENLERANTQENLNNFLDLGSFNFSASSVEKVMRYLNQESFTMGYKEIFEMLDIANYFMINSLVSLLESEFVNIISIDNVLCLLEVARDYSLFFLKRNCLIYLVLNYTEAKNRGLFKYMNNDDITEFKSLMKLNNKNI